ncbi:MAG: ABC transporter ATP-binding protein [Pseudonocardiales bacterium]
MRLAWQADRRCVVQLLGVQLATAIGLLGIILLMRQLLGGVFAEHSTTGAETDTDLVIPGIFAMIALGTVSGILRAVGNARQRLLAVKMDRHIVSIVLRSAVRAELARFEDPAFHDGLQRAVFAARSQPVVVVTTMVALLQTVLTLGAVTAAFVMMAWWLLPFAALSAVPIARAARNERDAGYRLNHDLAENRRMRQYLERLLTGRDEAKEIRALNLGALLWSRWHAQYQNEIDGTAATSRTHLRHKIIARITGDVLTIAVIGGLSWLLVVGALTVPTALAALTGLWLLSTRLRMVGAMLNDVGESLLYLTDLRTFVAGDTTPPQPATRPARFSGLHAEGIGFRYPGSARQVLTDVTISLGAGELVALVGANGSGKTTLAKILAGLYQVDTGVLLHGDEVVEPGALRNQTAVVFQDFIRYKLPAIDSISFGRPDEPTSMQRAVAAAGLAGADEFLAELPDGYKTVLSKEFTGGTDLSLGQWQRLALARAFYRDSSFVILDEPTASLDPQAEAELFARLRVLFAGRTVLLITHRFSSVRSADRIYVLDGGRVVEAGTHESLMSADETYAKLYRLQADAYQEIR